MIEHLRVWVMATKLSLMRYNRKMADDLKYELSEKAQLELFPKSTKDFLAELEAEHNRVIEQVTCPHCGKTGGPSGMRQHHFDKCKKKEK